ncbi:MAG: hypothetical protein IKB02_02720 [Clostridia bacterium]|nr:hypothetical protein [Clostridia bacterium]
MKYTEKYKVRWHDTDAMRKVRPSELLVYMQETANRQFESVGRDLDAERDTKKVAFILSRISLDFYAPLHAYEEIEVDTFTCESRGFSFERGFLIRRGEETVAKGASVWALVNIENGSLLRAESYDVEFENEPKAVTETPLRIRIPKHEEFELVGKRKITYSDIDYNMHMNNTKYPNMLCDFMELDDTEKIAGMSLSYLHEAALGDEIDIYRVKTDDGYFFKTMNKDGKVLLEALVVCK